MFVKYRKIFYAITALLMAASIVSLAVFGLRFGIAFNGGSILEISFNENRPSNAQVEEKLKELGVEEFTIQPSGEKDMIIRMAPVSQENHQKILESLGILSPLEEKRFESIGPTIGSELKNKANMVVVLSLLAVVAYIALAFSKVKKPVRFWQYSAVSLFVLFHDVILVLGTFALLGELYNTEITIAILVAILTIVGYDINNVVVVFDRMRENLLKGRFANEENYFSNIVNASVKQTLSRQINIFLITLFPLLAIYFFGGEALKDFALALIVGVLAGLYSSIFLASPLIFTWLKASKKI